MSASGTGSAARWVMLVLMLGGSGWASFTLYERTTQASVEAHPVADPRVEQLVAEGFKHLAADELDTASEKLNKAAGAASGDPRVHEGLVLVAVRRAERIWWEVELAPEGADRKKRVEDLDHAVHKAREVIANARRDVSDQPTIDRIGMHERRLNTMLVVAFAMTGETERARGALGARLSTHPQRALLERWVGVAPTPTPATSAAASASASAAASAIPSAPAPAGGGTFPPTTGKPSTYEPHYELDQEPAMTDKPKTPGELELPTTAPPPVPAPEPE